MNLLEDEQKEHPLEAIKRLLQYCDKSFSRAPESQERKLLNDAHISYQALNVLDAIMMVPRGPSF